MFKDPANHLYLIFLKSILHEINEANVLFQSTQQESTKVYKTLTALVLSVATRIIKPLFIASAIKTEGKFNCIKDALNNELALQLLTKVNFGIEFKNVAAAYNLKSEDFRRCQNSMSSVFNYFTNRTSQTYSK